MSADFHEVEATDGVRFSWNVWPSSRLEATRMVVPLGCLYTPLKPIAELPLLPYEPVVCKGTCPSILNPFCRIDFKAKIWVCPFCFQRNHFPPHYNDINENNLPAELYPSYTTIEYALPRAPAGPPTFLWVIDTCLDEAELQALKDSLEQALQLLSSTVPNALLGLITFGTTVQIHELGYEHCAKSYTFSGKKDLEPNRLNELLGLGGGGRGGQQQPAANDARSASVRFLLPVAEAEFAISNVLSELRMDPWPLEAGHRAARCTGVALSTAVALLESNFANHGARVMLFTGGPCTIGPGQMVAKELSEPMRSHHDIEKETGNTKFVKKASKHYAAIAKRAVAAGHAIDVFACALDQVGLMEMRPILEKTGGCTRAPNAHRTRRPATGDTAPPCAPARAHTPSLALEARGFAWPPFPLTRHSDDATLSSRVVKQTWSCPSRSRAISSSSHSRGSSRATRRVSTCACPLGLRSRS